MKTTSINPTIAAQLTQEIEFSGIAAYAQFMGLESEHSDDIESMTADQLMTAAELTAEQAETLLIAISIADDPGLLGAYQVLVAAQ